MPRLTQPRTGEPIKLVQTATGEWRYQVVLTATPRGAAKRQQVRRNFPGTAEGLREARAFVDETRTSVRNGEPVVRSTVTISELCDRWLKVREADVLSGELRRVTLEGYSNWLKPVRTFMGARRVVDVRYSDVEAFKAWALREGRAHAKTPTGLKPRAVAGSLGVLGQVLQLAVRDRLITANPAADVERPSRKRSETGVSHWTVEQVARFVREADSEPLPLAVGLRLIACGMRRSEVVGQTWDALSLDTETAAVVQGRVALSSGKAEALTDPKSWASRRFVPYEVLAPGTTRLLRQLWVAAGQPAQGLVVADRDGKPARPHGVAPGPFVVLDPLGRPMRPEVLSDAFQRVAKRAGLPKIKMHAVRHSIATDLAADPTVPDIAAATLLGHDVATFHATYAQRTNEAAQLAAAAIGKRLRAASE